MYIRRVIVTQRLSTGDEVAIAIKKVDDFFKVKEVELFLSKINKKFKNTDSDDVLYYTYRHKFGEETFNVKVDTLEELLDVVRRELDGSKVFISSTNKSDS